MKQSSSKLSVGLIVRSTKTWHWQASLVQALIDARLISVEKILTLGDEPFVLPKATALLHRLDSLIFRSPMDAYDQAELDIPSASIEALSAQQEDSELDLWINLSERPVSDKLKVTAKLGLLEPHFSEQNLTESLNSALFGFSEFSRGEKQCYFSIIAHSNDETYLIAESRPSLDAGSLSRNMNQYWKLLESSWLGVFRHIQSKTFEEMQLRTLGEQPVPSPPADISPAKAYKQFAKTFSDKFKQKLLRKEQWVLLLQFQNQLLEPGKAPLSFADYIEISPPDSCFWADPFVITEDDRHYVFFEELPFATERGHLSCMEVFSDGSHTEPKIILKKPYHLSYPNVFCFESQYYMIPESGDAGVIELYRCAEFPYQWDHQCNLMEGLHAYDSTVVNHEGAWWLFACVAAEKGMSGCEELHIFYADSPLSQSWKAHSLNPIMSDASRARPAGQFFESEGKLYRPSQDCAGSYGAGLNLNQVITLNKNSYKEELVHCSRPTWDPKLTALHTLNFNQYVSVADAMRVDNRFF